MIQTNRSSLVLPKVGGHQLKRLACAVLLANLIAGCTVEEHQPSPKPQTSTQTPVAASPVAPSTAAQTTSPEPSPARPQSVAQTAPPAISRRLGDGTFINEAGAAAPTIPSIQLEGDDTYSINLVDVPVEQAARAVLGDTLGLSYVVSDEVTGNITVMTSRPLNRADLYATFEAVLSLNNLAMEEYDGTLLVLPSAQSTPRYRLAKARTPVEAGIIVIPLAYVGVAEMQRILEPIASPTLTLTANTQRNILFAAGRRSDIEAVLDAVNIFDVDILKGRSVSRVQLFAALPSEVALELDQVFDTGEGGSLEGVLRFVPNDATGSLLIISARRQYIAEAERWVRDFQRAYKGDKPVSVVYRLENREASDLAPVIESLLSFGSLDVGDEAGPGFLQSSISTSTTADTSTVAGASTDTASSDATSLGSAAGASVLADDISNSIVAYATPDQQFEIAELIRQLDDVAAQVLLEATIAEVALTGALDFGVRFFLESGDFATSFSGIASTGLGPIVPGFNAVFENGDFGIALNALAEITDVNVLSSPSLMVLDNREAELNVGDEVPVAVSSAVDVTDPNAPIVNEIQQRDTGVILNIKPRVASSGRVILEIRQEVSDVVTTTTSGIDSPTIRQRIVTTTVAVDDSQSLVIGGLIRESRTRVQQKVPLLGDIPVLGAAFRNTSDEDMRTELLVIITPRVVRNAVEAKEVTDEYREELTGPDELLGRPPSGPEHQLKRMFF